MGRFFQILAAALVALSVTVGTAHAQRTHVYLLRGFMDIFSTGMDDLGAKLNRRGIEASVHNHSEFQTLAAGIIDRHRSGKRENVVIIGHSLGGNDAFRMAEYLGEAKIKVPLIIAFDPTASMSVPRNVSRAVNFYSSTNGWGVPIVRGPGFRGSLSNVDLSKRGEMGHTDIDKSPSLHSRSINYVLAIGGSGRSGTAATPKPVPRDRDDAAEKTKGAKESAAKTAKKDAGKDKVPAADTKTAAKDSAEPAKESEAKTAEKSADKEMEPAADAKTAVKDSAEPAKQSAAKADESGTAAAAPAEATGSVAAKDEAAKPAAAKTETAASKPDESKSAN